MGVVYTEVGMASKFLRTLHVQDNNRALFKKSWIHPCILCQRQPKFASFGQLIQYLKDCYNWQVCTNQIARIGNFGQVQSFLYRKRERERERERCQRLPQQASFAQQFWTSAVFSPQREMSRIARIGNFGEVQSILSLQRGRCQRLPVLAKVNELKIANFCI